MPARPQLDEEVGAVGVRRQEETRGYLARPEGSQKSGTVLWVIIKANGRYLAITISSLRRTALHGQTMSQERRKKRRQLSPHFAERETRKKGHSRARAAFLYLPGSDSYSPRGLILWSTVTEVV